LAANESRQPPIGIKRRADDDSVRPGGIRRPRKASVPFRVQAIGQTRGCRTLTAPALMWLAVRAIRCKTQQARCDVQSGSWLFAKPLT